MSVKPVNDVSVPPNAIVLSPIVKLELANFAFVTSPSAIFAVVTFASTIFAP
jgi:hypothetical protein